MIDKPITYLSVNQGPNVGDNDAWIGVRVVPVGRDGKSIFARTLNEGEPDSGEGIIVQPGDERIVFPPGNLTITIKDIDRESRPRPDGYAAVSNTAWTWLTIRDWIGEGLSRREELFRCLFASARRLDTAHNLCLNLLEELGERPDEPFIKTRARLYRALGYAELMCVAFNRAAIMIDLISSQFATSTAVPANVVEIMPQLKAIRNAFEHIEERALGNVRGKPDPDALSIFDQIDLFNSGVIRYSGHSLDLTADMVPAFIASRKFIFEVAREKAGESFTYNNALEIHIGSGSC